MLNPLSDPLEPLGPQITRSAAWPHDTRQFNFAVIGDRIRGQGSGAAYMTALSKVASYQPDFIMTVGDLIDVDAGGAGAPWDQHNTLRTYMRDVPVPVLYVRGDHDIGAGGDTPWKKVYGNQTYYAMVYRDTLFLVLDTQDGGTHRISPQQRDWAMDILDTCCNPASKVPPKIRWTFVFVHVPWWMARPEVPHGTESWNFWNDIQGHLPRGTHTVFAGHIHGLDPTIHPHGYANTTIGSGQHIVVGATQGASSDQFLWVTMTERGPVITSTKLEGVSVLEPVPSLARGHFGITDNAVLQRL